MKRRNRYVNSNFKIGGKIPPFDQGTNDSCYRRRCRSGRAVRAVAILLAVYAFGNESIRVATIWKSIGTGLFGLALQWALIPLIVYRVENLKKKER